MEGQRKVLAVKERLRTQNPDGFYVMTDDQVEQLKKQIAVYAVICEQLVDMHKAFTAQQDLAGMKMGNVYGDLMPFGGNKVTARQRWTPSNTQLEILERIYNEANGTPGKHRVKEITKELSQHGQVTETNVYNWIRRQNLKTCNFEVLIQDMRTPNGTVEVPSGRVDVVGLYHFEVLSSLCFNRSL
ncbi:hypothetical protein ACLB2K_047500 [Fragaria x ananassa]